MSATSPKKAAATASSSSSTKPVSPTAAQPPLFEVEKHHSDAEVAERLFTVPDPEKVKAEVSSAWSWFASTTTATLASSTASLTSGIKSLGVDTDAISNFANIVADKTSAEPTAASATKKTAFLLPWEPLDGPHSAAIRDKVLALSKDENTFLVPPPAADGKTAAITQQRYNFTSDPEPATRMLEADPVLGAKRFKLVPKKVEENTFWANYFYRVQLIKDSFGNSTVPAGARNTPAKASQAGSPATSSSETPAASAAQTAATVAAVAATSSEIETKALEESLRTELALATEGKGPSEHEENFEMLDDDELLAGVIDESEE